MGVDRFVAATRDAVASRNWYAALAMALALPDVCGRVEYPGVGSRSRYAQWYEDYRYCGGQIGKNMPTGGDVYALRCAYFHQGEFDVSDHAARETTERFRFVEPIANWTIYHNRVKNEIQLQVSRFCEELCLAAERWLKAALPDPVKSAALAQLAEINILPPTGPIEL